MTVISEDASVNIGATVWPDADQAVSAVREIQNKLHCWATADSSRRFGDLYNWVCDPAVLTVAWQRVAGNTGSRTAGIDRATVSGIASQYGVTAFLGQVRHQLRSRIFRPVPVRQVMIPKLKLRRGLVLEPHGSGPKPRRNFRLTAESNTYAAPHWASATWPTTPPEHTWTPEDPEPKYTHFYDEPVETGSY